MSTTKKTYWNIFDFSDHFAQKQDSLDLRRSVFNTDSRGEYFPSEKLLNPTYTELNQRHIGLKKMYSIEQVDGIFILLLCSFVLLIHVHRRGFSFFRENIKLVFSSRYNISLFSESTISEFWYNFLLISQTIFLSSLVLFVYFFETDTHVAVTNTAHISVIIFSFVILIFFVEAIKYFFYRFVGFLFSMQTIVITWLRAYMIVFEILGILSFIPVLFLVYFDYCHPILFIFFFLLFLLSRLIIIYRLVSFFLDKGVNSLYMIAYLCSVELIPYILLYNGLVYLYKIDIINFLWP